MSASPQCPECRGAGVLRFDAFDPGEPCPCQRLGAPTRPEGLDFHKAQDALEGTVEFCDFFIPPLVRAELSRQHRAALDALRAKLESTERVNFSLCEKLGRARDERDALRAEYRERRYQERCVNCAFAVVRHTGPDMHDFETICGNDDSPAHERPVSFFGSDTCGHFKKWTPTHEDVPALPLPEVKP